MVWAQCEVVRSVQTRSQVGEQLVGNFDDRLTHLAYEVLVPVVGEVVHRAPVAEVDMIDDTELLERIESAVDGRPVDLRVRALYGRGEVVSGHM